MLPEAGKLFGQLRYIIIDEIFPAGNKRGIYYSVICHLRGLAPPA